MMTYSDEGSGLPLQLPHGVGEPVHPLSDGLSRGLDLRQALLDDPYIVLGPGQVLLDPFARLLQ